MVVAHDRQKIPLADRAEWEYAARGNAATARYWGDNPDEACGYAMLRTRQGRHRYVAHHLGRCISVRMALPIPLRQAASRTMHSAEGYAGNVWEWTEDSYHDSYKDAPADGSAWQGVGAKRVLRGVRGTTHRGSSRAAVRNSYKPELRYSFFGFRWPGSSRSVGGLIYAATLLRYSSNEFL